MNGRDPRKHAPPPSPPEPPEDEQKRGSLPLSPREEAFVRAYVALGCRVGDAARAVGIPHEEAEKLAKESRIQERAQQILRELLAPMGLTKASAIQRLAYWIQESVPHERIRAMELLARMADWFPAERKVHQHVSVPSGSSFAQLLMTLQHYGEQFTPEQLRMLKGRLQQELGYISQALELVDRLVSNTIDTEVVAIEPPRKGH